MNCPICKKHEKKKDLIYEDKNWIISSGPLASQILGYVYLEPKRHVENWVELSNEELLQIGPIIQKVEKSLKELISIDRLYFVTISEAVRHLHFHLIPRSDDCDKKGIPLIEQATQQNEKTNELKKETLDLLMEKLKEKLLTIN